MAENRKPKQEPTTKGGDRDPVDGPRLFRINVEVGNLDDAAKFYGTLFGLVGRLQAGSRCYFTCGSVTLQVVDARQCGVPHPAAKALYLWWTTSMRCSSGRSRWAASRRTKSMACRPARSA